MSSVELQREGDGEDAKQDKKCVVCGDDRDVRKHYGVTCCYGCKAFFRRSINDKKDLSYKCLQNNACSVEKESRNRCKSCRFDKCVSMGMSENNLRDYKFKSKQPIEPPTLDEVTKPHDKSPTDNPPPQTSAAIAPDMSNHCGCPPNKEAMKLVNFLTRMADVVLNIFDPNFVDLTREQWIELERGFGRDVSLSQGLKDPSKVCPRTKWDWSASRKAEVHDISFMWYRYFVTVADYANSIPQFRVLPEKDQLDLMKLNFLNVSIVFLMYYILDDTLVSSDVIPIGNGSFVSKYDQAETLGKLVRSSLNANDTYLFKPALELDVDKTELVILAGIRLFQYHENLTAEGQTISKAYLDQLYEALFEYQCRRFKDKPVSERAKRQSKLLMMTARYFQIWSMESDVHLMLCTFQKMNLDGIPKELLFSDFEFKNKLSS